MATTRFGHLDDFTLKNSKVGIGTSDPTEALEVIGGSRSQDIKVTGIASLTSYEGFQNIKTSYADNVNITGGESGTLSGEIVIGAGLTMSVGTGATTGQGSIKSLKVSNTFTPPIGGTNDRPSAPKPGALYYNKDFRTIEYWDGNFWRQVDYTTTSGRAIHAGGANDATSYAGFIVKFEMATAGNSIGFGELTKPGQGLEGYSSSTRGCFTGRKTPSEDPADDIEYITIASEGNSIYFGNLSSARRLGGAFSSSTRGILAGGLNPTYLNVIDYVEISTLGNAIDFGDTIGAGALIAGCSSPTRGIFNTGRIPATWYSRVEEVTIASKGNSIKFGDLTVAPASGAACSNSVRGFFAGGHTNPSWNAITDGPIDYISLASGGNAVRFGNLSDYNTSFTAAASQTRGFFIGGQRSPVILNSIEYIVFSSEGNAIDFGDLGTESESGGALSDSHGGLGGY